MIVADMDAAQAAIGVPRIPPVCNPGFTADIVAVDIAPTVAGLGSDIEARPVEPGLDARGIRRHRVARSGKQD